MGKKKEYVARSFEPNTGCVQAQAQGQGRPSSSSAEAGELELSDRRNPIPGLRVNVARLLVNLRIGPSLEACLSPAESTLGGAAGTGTGAAEGQRQTQMQTALRTLPLHETCTARVPVHGASSTPT